MQKRDGDCLACTSGGERQRDTTCSTRTGHDGIGGKCIKQLLKTAVLQWLLLKWGLWLLHAGSIRPDMLDLLHETVQ